MILRFRPVVAAPVLQHAATANTHNTHNTHNTQPVVNGNFGKSCVRCKIFKIFKTDKDHVSGLASWHAIVFCAPKLAVFLRGVSHVWLTSCAVLPQTQKLRT